MILTKSPYCIKICRHCGKLLVANTNNFVKSKKSKYGVENCCKQCKKEYDQKHYKQYYQNNKDHIKETTKKYKDNNKDYYKNYNKQYYQNNKEELSEQQKCYRESNKEKIKETKRIWYKNNPDKVFNSHNRRRQLKESQGTGITKEQWFEMMEFFDWKDAYSGEKLTDKNRTIDHIIPLVNGGLNEAWNCIPATKSNNSSKGAKDMLEWYKEQSFFSEERLNKIYEWEEKAANVPPMLENEENNEDVVNDEEEE